MLGEGIFETMVWRNGRVEALRRHWLRLCEGAAELGLPAPTLEEMNAALAAVVEANPGCHRLRYTICRGIADAVDVCAAATPLTNWPAVERVTLVPWRRNAKGALAHIKSVSYLENVLTLRQAQEKGYGEGLLGNTSDQLCEGSGSNVFVVLNGRLLTPPLTSGCLPGVTRALLLESGIAVEEDLPLDCLRRITELFLTSSTRGVQAVGEVDGRALPEVNGAFTQAARLALEQRLTES